MSDPGLKGAEKATTAGDSQDHAAEFAQNLLPSLEGNTLTATEIIKNGAQADVAVRRQFQGLFGRVDEPAKQEFGGAPTAVTLEKLLDGNRLLMEGVEGIKGANDLVNGVKQDTAGNTAATGTALNQITKIVDIHVGVGQGERKRLAAGDGNRGEGSRHAWHSARN
jgi:hypothetical protein